MTYTDVDKSVFWVSPVTDTPDLYKPQCMRFVEGFRREVSFLVGEKKVCYLDYHLYNILFIILGYASLKKGVDFTFPGPNTNPTLFGCEVQIAPQPLIDGRVYFASENTA